MIRTEILSNLWSDIRYAVRVLWCNPGFAAAAIAPLALGIGINTGVFSILNSIAWRSLPTPESTELVSIYQEFRGKRRVHGARSMFSIPEYRAYRDGAQTLSGVMAYSTPWTVTLGGQSPQEIKGVLVTCNYFDVLRVRPVIGPGFTAANCDTPDAPGEVILSYSLWTRAFAADADIVGKAIKLNGQSVSVVGVSAEGFDGIDLTKVALFASTSLQPVFHPDREDFHEDAHSSWLTLIGRRNQGTGIEMVRAELAVIASRIDQQQPGRTTTLIVAPARSLSLPVARREILSIGAIVLAAFGLVLLIACANVANVLLARAAGRTKEVAVRLSVGATRGRLIRQLLTESVIIALAGGLAGSLLAWGSFQALLAWLLSSLPGTIPPLRIDAHPNLTVLWFALGLTVATALLFGMAPAFRASRQDVHAAMKQEGAGSGGWTGTWLRGMLISIQVAVCVVLLISSGLLLRALYAAQTIDPGFDYDHVAVLSIKLRGSGHDDAAVGTFQRQLIERIGSLPAVEAVARASKIPLSPGRHQTMFRLPGQEEWREVDVNTVSPEYFSLIGIPLVCGRTFSTAELEGRSGAVIITEATARRHWPDQDPIGRPLVMSLGPDEEVSLEIVGVTKDAHVSHLAQTDSSYIYLPAKPQPEGRLNLLVRSQANFGTLARSIRALTGELDPGLVAQVYPLEENLEFWRAGSRLLASLSGLLSLLALVLASIGVYGVVSYIVSRRRREVAIRSTLGASARNVQSLILRQTLSPVIVGVIIGIAGAAAASRILESVLFGISPFDPIAFIGAPLFLLGVAAAASLLPTQQALRLDPMSTLRYE